MGRCARGQGSPAALAELGAGARRLSGTQGKRLVAQLQAALDAVKPFLCSRLRVRETRLDGRKAVLDDTQAQLDPIQALADPGDVPTDRAQLLQDQVVCAGGVL